ncbi:EamA-like transporter family protein [Pseudoduganella lurida]|uniref:EamA-like transporter family protein n=1 Tax=Pseudoduganella lurida TaxID=1036180 RepID=A0A562RC55_9BURK|nr:DMT family transporter [Pseudoduganella lurida]TWI66618.1 EamA-like transporter family protein [Pseudoduganella lurida]
MSTLATRSGALPAETAGMLLGLAGVAIFSLTLPFTRLAVAEIDPLFATVGRAVVAALLSLAWLRWARVPPPPRAALPALALVAAGCVIGFPLLTSIAMRTLPAAHGAVLVGILPLATALRAALRGHERPSAGFWCMALAGSGLVIAFALRDSGGTLQSADLLMLAAVAAAGIGYAEGGRLAQQMGGQQVIGWALVLALPVSLPLTAWRAWQHGAALASASPAAWTGFAYLGVFSMFIGFVFWYRGMALGGVARVGQVQLLQPFLSLLGAALVLGEPLQADHLAFALAVIAVVALGRRMAVKR